MHPIGRRRESAKDPERPSAIGHLEARHHVNPRGLAVDPAPEDHLSRLEEAASRLESAPGCRKSCRRGVAPLERWQGSSGGQDGVAIPALPQAVELPHAEPDGNRGQHQGNQAEELAPKSGHL